VTGKGIFAGGIFFVAKEYPSRTLPKKAIGKISLPALSAISPRYCHFIATWGKHILEFVPRNIPYRFLEGGAGEGFFGIKEPLPRHYPSSHPQGGYYV